MKLYVRRCDYFVDNSTEIRKIHFGKPPLGGRADYGLHTEEDVEFEIPDSVIIAALVESIGIPGILDLVHQHDLSGNPTEPLLNWVFDHFNVS